MGVLTPDAHLKSASEWKKIGRERASAFLLSLSRSDCFLSLQVLKKLTLFHFICVAPRSLALSPLRQLLAAFFTTPFTMLRLSARSAVIPSRMPPFAASSSHARPRATTTAKKNSQQRRQSATITVAASSASAPVFSPPSSLRSRLAPARLHPVSTYRGARPGAPN